MKSHIKYVSFYNKRGRLWSKFLLLALVAALLAACEDSSSNSARRGNRHLPDNFVLPHPDSINSAPSGSSLAILLQEERGKEQERAARAEIGEEINSEANSLAHPLIDFLFNGDETGEGVYDVVVQLEFYFTVMDQLLDQLKASGMNDNISLEEGDFTVTFTQIMKDAFQANLEAHGIAFDQDAGALLPTVGSPLPNPPLCYKVRSAPLQYQLRFIDARGGNAARPAPDCDQPLGADAYQFSWNEGRNRIEINLPDELGVDRFFYDDLAQEMQIESIDLSADSSDSRFRIAAKGCGLSKNCMRLWVDVPQEFERRSDVEEPDSYRIVGMADDNGGVLQARLFRPAEENHYYQEIFTGRGTLQASRYREGNNDWSQQMGDFSRIPYLSSDEIEPDGLFKEEAFELDFSSL